MNALSIKAIARMLRAMVRKRNAAQATAHAALTAAAAYDRALSAIAAECGPTAPLDTPPPVVTLPAGLTPGTQLAAVYKALADCPDQQSRFSVLQDVTSLRSGAISVALATLRRKHLATNPARGVWKLTT